MNDDLGPVLAVQLEIRIRACRRDDLARLEWTDAEVAHRGIATLAFERHMRGENPMLVADANGSPVGQVWIDLTKRARERVGVIWALRVLPALRGLGVGRALVAAAEQRMSSAGCVAAEIGVEHGNPAARALYEALGYQIFACEREPYSYVTPDERVVDAVFEGVLLRKTLRSAQRRLDARDRSASLSARALHDPAQEDDACAIESRRDSESAGRSET